MKPFLIYTSTNEMRLIQQRSKEDTKKRKKSSHANYLATVWKNNLPLNLDGIGGKRRFLMCLERAYSVLSILLWSINFRSFMSSLVLKVLCAVYRSTKIRIIIKRCFFKKSITIYLLVTGHLFSCFFLSILL